MVDVDDFLRSNQIDFVRHEHAAVFTGEELEKLSLPGMTCKNLFVRDQKSTRFILVILPANKKADLKKIGELTGAGKLSFVNPEVLWQKLGVTPGSISPFGLLNNSQADVEVLIDQEVTLAPIVLFHPNKNTATLQLTKEMFGRYLGLIKNNITITESL